VAEASGMCLAMLADWLEDGVNGASEVSGPIQWSYF
jgi:hypothetical protein